MNHQANPGATPNNNSADALILFHDGCSVCLDVAQALGRTIPGLRIVDLGRDPASIPEATAHGVLELPSLVVGSTVVPLAPHSQLADLGTHPVAG